MNNFLTHLLICLDDEKELIQELLSIDNEIQTTNLRYEKLVAFVRSNLATERFISVVLEEDSLVLTEGNPILIIKLLNDFPNSLKRLFISREYLGINKWLVMKHFEYCHGQGVELIEEESYHRYLTAESPNAAFGSEGFIEAVAEDFARDITKYETE